MPWRLRAHPAALKPTLEAVSEAARCKAAEDLLDLMKVKSAMAKAADQGLRVCVFRPSLPVNLKGTPAADALEAWAAKEGLAVEWSQPEIVSEGGFDIGQRVAVALRWEDRLMSEPAI